MKCPMIWTVQARNLLCICFLCLARYLYKRSAVAFSCCSVSLYAIADCFKIIGIGLWMCVRVCVQCVHSFGSHLLLCPSTENRKRRSETDERDAHLFTFAFILTATEKTQLIRRTKDMTWSRAHNIVCWIESSCYFGQANTCCEVKFAMNDNCFLCYSGRLHSPSLSIPILVSVFHRLCVSVMNFSVPCYDVVAILSHWNNLRRLFFSSIHLFYFLGILRMEWRYVSFIVLAIEPVLREALIRN